MGRQPIVRAKPVPVQRFTWVLVAAWTVFIAIFSWHEIQDQRQLTRDMAIHEVRAYFNKDRALRTWSASHGGVYVPVDARTPPSPYLSHVPERDVRTPSGRKLTLMNPAYMMRQLSEDFSSLYGVVARITSLHPLRPENGPDEWERRALIEFEQKKLEEKVEFTDIAGVPHLRLIQPVFVSQDCLRCHARQGYKLGDIRGGISIGIPMTEALAMEQRKVRAQLVSDVLTWLLGVIGLLVGGIVLQDRIRERDEAQQALEESLLRLASKTEELALANDSLTREVAERKRVEAEILRSEEKFRTVADFTCDWEYWMAPDGAYIYVSPAAERITGYTSEEFVANPGLALEIVHPDHQALMADHFGQALDDHQVCMLEFRIVTRDGRDRWISHICQPVYSESGRFCGRRASNRDVTAAKQADRALNKFATELSQSNRDLQGFAYMVSHDLREPLVLIQAFSDRLRQKFGANIPERGLEYLARIEAAASRMQELINGVLAYSRITSKGQLLEEVDLSRIMTEVVADLEMRIRKSGGEVVVGELGWIKADPLQIRQLLQNLVGNGLKYSRPEVPPRVVVSAERANVMQEDGSIVELCRITVEDNGIGFEPEAAGQIFGLFKRLHGRSQYEGTGIGLAVCKRIAERHGGTISAEGTPGEGARFVVSLPIRGPVADDSATQGNAGADA
ncbi:MAG: ATP-binding protein [Thermodesulfobacteriota bacterium]